MSPRASSGPEIQRILALVPWIVAHPGTTKEQIATRFGISVEQLDDDLALVLMVGIPPYSPGDFVDVDEDDEGHVTIRLADTFRRPLRLTPAEGLALLAAGRALLAVPGSDPEGPLATALTKLERALDLPDLVVDVRDSEQLQAVRDAVAGHSRVEIDYWSAGRDEMTTRLIDPEVVFFAMGEWYVGAYCHHARDERMFRVDRIRAVRTTAETFEPGATGFEAGAVFRPRDADPRVTLRLKPEAAWVAEEYPTEALTERADGSLDVVLAVSERAWLERLLLRLGPDAKVTAPADWRKAGSEAATRILSGYRDNRASRTAPSGRPDSRARERA
ncbi:MAG TPA: WYL domain-containing protein [Acidimicrobiia bacterium]|jgi:proteasome accessory factor C|nr:WYL domain-containing protein [Acidimicrobiia bacterium]